MLTKKLVLSFISHQKVIEIIEKNIATTGAKDDDVGDDDGISKRVMTIMCLSEEMDGPMRIGGHERGRDNSVWPELKIG